MGWAVGTLALTAAVVFFAVGAIYEDGGLSLARCLDRVKYSVSVPERVFATVTGLFLVVMLYTLTGMLRLLTLAVGALTIITGELAQRIGGMLPPYPMGSERHREVEE
jgi:hypothetical protein